MLQYIINMAVKHIFDPKAKIAGIAIGFKVPDVNWFVMRKLKKGEPCNCSELAHGSEQTACVYAVYQTVCKNIVGDPRIREKTGADKCLFNYQNGEAVIIISAPATNSNIKTLLRLVAKSLTPQKFYPQYSINIRMLNGSPKRDEFNYCCNNMKLDCNIVIVSSLKNANEKDLHSVFVSKLTKFEKQQPASKPVSLAKARGSTEFPTLNIKSDVARLLVADYISASGVNTALIDSHIVVYYPADRWETVRKMLDDSKKIDRYVDSHYRLKNFNSAIVYDALMSGQLNVPAIKSFASKTPSMAEIKKIIKSGI